MKKNILILIMLSIFTSCNEIKPMLFSDNNAKLSFIFDKKNNPDSTTRQTFVYDHAEVVRDTVYINIRCTGFQTDYDREISLVQEEAKEGENKANPGEHYVDFNDKEVAKYYILKAGKSTVSVPVILLRHLSMKDKEFTLNVGLRENNFFSLGFKGETIRKIVTADILTKPSRWFSFFGDYGPVKHQFMIDVSDGIKWDDEFFEQFWDIANISYTRYWVARLSKELKEYNEKLDPTGVIVLTENDKDKTPVTFD